MQASVRSGSILQSSLSGLLFFVLILGLFRAEAVAYERKILAEIFTNTSCPLCPRYIPPAQDTLEAMLDENQFVFITHHTWWPEISDPWYIENYERHLPSDDDVMARMNWMGRDQWMGVPSFYFDGTRFDFHEGDYIGGIAEFIPERIEVESPLNIDLQAFAHDNDLIARVTVLSDERLSNITLFIALCEIEVEWQALSGQHRFTGNMLDMFPEGSGQQFSILADIPVEFEEYTSLDVGWRENEVEDLCVHAWVQRQNSQEVLQAEKTGIIAVEPPEAFNLIAPQDGYEVNRNDTRVEFEWEESAVEEGYELTYDLYLDILTDGSMPMCIDGIRETACTHCIDSLLINRGVMNDGQDEDVEIEWWVEATNGIMKTESTERRILTAPVPTSAPSLIPLLPSSLILQEAFPNPFNGWLTVPFMLDRVGRTVLTLHDLSGAVVATLVNVDLPSGRHTASLNAAHLNLSNGIYYICLTQNGQKAVGKVVYLR